MSDTPTPADDDTVDWPDAVDPDDVDDDRRGGQHFAGQHDDEPDVAEEPNPDRPEAS